MRLLRNKLFQNYFLITTGLMLIEITFRLISGLQVFNFSLLRVLISSSIIALLFGYLFTHFKNTLRYICNLITVFIATVYVFFQLAFNTYIGVYASVNASSQFGAVVDYIKDFIKSIRPEYYLIFIPWLALVALVILGKVLSKRKPELFTLKRKYKYENIIMFLDAVIFLIFAIGLYGYTLSDEFADDEYQVISNVDLFWSASNPTLCVKEFGIISYAFIDAKTMFYEVENTQLDYIALHGSADLTDEEKRRKFDDSAWEEIMETETNSTYKTLHNYFINNNITNKNDMTGVFEDKNVIVIMMESVNDVIFMEEYFPNFQKIASQGWNFINNYSPRNSCATGNNEFSSITGIYSIYNDCTMNVYLENTYPNSLFNLFNDAGYITSSFHNYSEHYYLRSITHPNMGSNTFYDVNNLNIEFDPNYGGWASDEDLMYEYLRVLDESILNTEDNFMSFMVTVSSHQPFRNDSKFGNLHLDLTEGTNYSMDTRRYISKLKVLDNALGILLEGLEERDVLKDTVIVLWGDHYPYGLSNEQLAEVLDRDLEGYEVERVPLIIYNPELEAKEFEMYTSYVNLTPTLANLFDLDFDPRYYVGTDIFSEEYENMVVFADGSWQSDKAYYDAISASITYEDDTFSYTDEEIRNINAAIYSKVNASSLAIKNNYFAYLDTKLKMFEEKENE